MASPFTRFSGPATPPLNPTGKVPSLIEPEISGNLEDHVMPNPSIPRLLVKITRNGQSDTLTINPESMEWILSTEGADMLKLTVPDPEYLLIDHPLLVEDFKTEVEFRYGYNTNMSQVGYMRYFNQRPEFPESGGVKTTLVCYDMSVFLNFDMIGRTIEGPEKIGVKDIIEASLRDAQDQFGITLTPVYDSGAGEAEFENQFYRVSRPHGKLIDHLSYLASTARVTNLPDETMREVYVENDKLHFHPPGRRLDPQGAYAYFSEHPGARLLSFSPQTALEFTARPVETTGINSDTGAVEGHEADGRSGEARPTNSQGTVRHDGNTGQATFVANRGGDSPEQTQQSVTERQYVVTGNEGDNIMGILEQFPGSNYQMFLEANRDVFESSDGSLDPVNFELTPGQTLIIPIPDVEERVETTESTAQAKATHLAYESRALNATATILGNPRLRAGWPVDIFNVGLKYEGRWYVRECTHRYGSDGYRVSFDLTREGINYGDGIESANGATPAFEPVAPVDPETTAPLIRTDGIDGSTFDR